MADEVWPRDNDAGQADDGRVFAWWDGSWWFDSRRVPADEVPPLTRLPVIHL